MDMDKIRSFARGDISANELRAYLNDDDNIPELEDEEFLQECSNIAMGLIIQGEMLDESGDIFDSTINETYSELHNYLVGQGIMNEASISITNPKINYVRLNKQAQIARLTKIVTLKLARKANSPFFKKYKIAMAMKKKNMGEMDKLFGARASRIDKQIWLKTARNGKV